MIKFISYDGKWPNLCRGILVIEKEGKRYELKNILISGGRCYFTDNYTNSHIEKGKWSIYGNKLPRELQNVQDVMEIKYLVNENVTWGCCGGCL